MNVRMRNKKNQTESKGIDDCLTRIHEQMKSRKGARMQQMDEDYQKKRTYKQQRW